MSKIPEIRIYFAWLLEEEGHKLAPHLPKKSANQYQQWAKNYSQAWSKHESKILPALQDALGVHFYKTVIDVPCAPNFIPKSDPLIMNFRGHPDEFVDVLTHELCHVLLTDNNKIQINGKDIKNRLGDVWVELFGSHDFNTLVHIPVQALMKHIYLDVLNEPKRLERDIDDSKKYGLAYIDSWQYVQDGDYKEIIAKLKKSYAEMK